MSVAPNTIEALEAAIVARLGAALPDVEVAPYPADPANYQFLHPVGALLVRYHGSHYGALMDTDAVVQERLLAVEITFLFRALNGQDGLYAYLERARRVLTGFKPAGFGKVYPLRDAFLEEHGGEWRYAVDFCAPTLAIEDGCEEDGPLLKHVTTLDGYERAETVRQPDGSTTYEEYAQ
ncbi:conserved hypothetical protein [Methylococcus capsulatus str. Bath]|uniref:Gp37 n=1 Tax=Methylococcus capsulatus (strain ATCC 33009 / NCIMB 11132 / Bath) TaxID=243233 RepID=Q602Y7_METCA|nr:Gp37 family protein [Methylococcus capsulatus]AAU90999.1 conserved hypothetical protein [Methylococcus capsulatus str. Bath]